MLDFNLQAGYLLKASTENAEATNVIVEGNDWKYPVDTSISNFTPASGTNTVAEEVLHTLTVPANMLTTGNLLHIYASLEMNSNANNKTFKLYTNTTSALTGATLIAQYSVKNVTDDNISRYFPIISDTSVEAYGGSGTSIQNQYVNNNGSTSGTITVASVSAGFFILITGTKAVGTDTDTIRWSMARKVF
jgi:hypothetical protein